MLNNDESFKKAGRPCSSYKTEKQYSFCNFKDAESSLVSSKYNNKQNAEQSSYTNEATANNKGNERVQHDASIRSFMK